MKSSRRVLLLLLGVALASGATLAEREAQRRRDEFPADKDLAYLPRPSLLRALSLGHPELAADLVFIRTITYFGTQFAADKNYDWLPRHVDTIIELDPWFLGAYRFAGLALMYNGRPITNREVRESSRFLELGAKRFPSNWELSFMLGCNYLFELKTDDPAEKERNRHLGGQWIRRAAIAGGPAWLPGLAATIMSREGETEAALRYLEEAYLTATDDRTREEVGRLLAARRAESLQQLTRARDAFMAGWKKRLPYAPGDLYVLTGEPPSTRLDWRHLVQQGAIERVLASEASESGSGAQPAPPAEPAPPIEPAPAATAPDGGPR